MHFMSAIYRLDETEKRKLHFLYRHSGIENRYSVIDDFSQSCSEWDFIPQCNNMPFSQLEDRMKVYAKEAAPLSVRAIKDCIEGHITAGEITHLITVSCTGMSAPGLDLQVAEAMQLPPSVFRTSVNFMGCYAAVHALKLAKLVCDTSPSANVVIVATELCTIHFQESYTADNAAAGLLFADGCAAVLVSGNSSKAGTGLSLNGFYSQVAYRGKNDMAWQLSSKGFLMTLSGYVPDIVEEDIAQLVNNALQHYGLQKKDVKHWCVHPGGKKILEVIEKQLLLGKDALCSSRRILATHGNMSSPTVLFVLKDMLEQKHTQGNIMGIAFGPGLTMETFIASA